MFMRCVIIYSFRGNLQKYWYTYLCKPPDPLGSGYFLPKLLSLVLVVRISYLVIYGSSQITIYILLAVSTLSTGNPLLLKELMSSSKLRINFRSNFLSVGDTAVTSISNRVLILTFLEQTP